MADARKLSRSIEEQSKVALLLIDVINRFEFPGSDQLLKSASRASRAIAALKANATEAGIPVVYVNDNFGRWRSDFRALVRACRGPMARGEVITERLAPTPKDYFVLKPTNSGFHATVMEVLLRDIGVQALVLAGFATDNCVLFTAHDAYLRGFELHVPRDCCAAESPARHARAMEIMRRTMKASTTPGAKLDLQKLTRG